MSTDNKHIEPNDAFLPQRERVNIVVNGLVRHQESVYRITQVLDFESIIGTEVESRRSVPLMIRDLRPLGTEEPVKHSSENDLAEIADHHWAMAQERYAAIKPFLIGTVSPRSEVTQRAEQFNVNTATLYRWIKRYRLRGQITDLIPGTQGRKKGENRVNYQAEAVINEVMMSPT